MEGQVTDTHRNLNGSTKWEEVKEKLDQVCRVVLEGGGEKEILKLLNITKQTFLRYKKKYPEFKAAVSVSGDAADILAERALLKLAVGYTVKEKKIIKLKEVDYDNGKKIEEREVLKPVEEEKNVPSNFSALSFWLKNRCPERWDEKTEIGDGGNTPENETESGIILMPAVNIESGVEEDVMVKKEAEEN